MSWSVSFIGKPENVVVALEQERHRMDGQSKVEYEAAWQSLATLVRENFGSQEEGYPEPVVKLEASGHGYSRDGEQLQRGLTVKLEPCYTKLV
jgi:hypothetical protein